MILGQEYIASFLFSQTFVRRPQKAGASLTAIPIQLRRSVPRREADRAIRVDGHADVNNVWGIAHMGQS